MALWSEMPVSDTVKLARWRLRMTHQLRCTDLLKSLFTISIESSISIGKPVDNDTAYNDVDVNGEQVIAWQGRDGSIDIWDISGPRPTLVQRQNCKCTFGNQAAIGLQAPLVALVTPEGSLVIWDYKNNNVYARKLVARDAQDSIDPLAIVGDNLVLFPLSPNRGERQDTSSLLAWDIQSDSVTEFWDGSGGAVSNVWPSNSGESILIEVSDRQGKPKPSIWFGLVRLT
jgi:hypothetical protein